ncbi:HNH endonuclease [Staphylococcus phage Alsa_2]|nr:HNH endonuclease [Staphylococcus phage Alsa_2]
MKEIWKVLKENNNYEVSNTGKVRNKETKQELKPWILNSGYYSITLYGNNYYKRHRTVHRLVAETFIENNDSHKNIINHIDNNKLNNHVDNLEWVDYKGNTLHANRQGRLNTHSAREQLKNVSSKAVFQKDMQGNITKIWDSPTQAEKETDKYFSQAKISSVANGKRKHHRNYIWEYVNKNSTRSLPMKINVYDLDNNLLHENYTMNKIMKLLNMNNHVTLRDRLRKTNDFVEYKGYKFKNNK